MSEPPSNLGPFSGTARLFPLPNLVLFPHVVQPLHIFEPRYRQMVRDALAADRLLALVLLRPGWENDYEGKPPIHAVACMGRILAEQRLKDGRYNLMMRGLSRVRLVEELDGKMPYRTARVEVLVEEVPPAGTATQQLRRRLAERIPVWFAEQEAILTQFQKLFQSDLALGPLCDILSFALTLPMEFKQELLATVSVAERARKLLKHLNGPPTAADPTAVERGFPPKFSDN